MPMRWIIRTGLVGSTITAVILVAPTGARIQGVDASRTMFDARNYELDVTGMRNGVAPPVPM